MHRILFSFICISLSLISQLNAQSYATTLGVRFGNDQIKRTAGLTVQQRIAPHLTLEGIIQSDFRYNTTGHALFKWHQSILSRRLNFFMGAGLSAGTEESENVDPQTMQIINTYGNTTFGADMMAGVELTLAKYNVSVDYKPNFNITGRNPWFAGQVGISLRAVIVKGATQNKRWRQRRREKRREERKEKIWFPLKEKLKDNGKN